MGTIIVVVEQGISFSYAFLPSPLLQSRIQYIRSCQWVFQATSNRPMCSDSPSSSIYFYHVIFCRNRPLAIWRTRNGDRRTFNDVPSTFHTMSMTVSSIDTSEGDRAIKRGIRYYYVSPRLLLALIPKP